jgi:hypothetical protein
MPRDDRHTRTAPDREEPPPGWAFAPPDFVGVGAQRSGTSWWHRLILDHPRVEGPRTLIASERDKARSKELHYFDRFETAPFSPADAETYTRFFPRPPGALSGEWTPRYMHDYWTPRLVQLAAPQAKVLVMLRDPVERYASALTRRATRRVRSAVPELGPKLSSGTLSRGLYHEQLSRLLRHFDQSRVLVLQYERCSAAPHAELRRTYEFLGLDDPDHEPAELREGGKEQARWSMRPGLREELVARLRPDVERLADDFPEIDLQLWPHFADVAAESRARSTAAAGGEGSGRAPVSR